MITFPTMIPSLSYHKYGAHLMRHIIGILMHWLCTIWRANSLVAYCLVEPLGMLPNFFSHCILTCVSSDGVMSEVVEKPKGIRRTIRIFVVHCEVKLEQCINAAFLPKSTGLSFSSSNLSSNNDTAIAVSQSFVESQHPPNESEQVHGASNSCPNSPISSQHTRTWPLPETRSSMTDEDILSSRLIVRSSSCSSTPAQLPTPQPTNVKLGVDSRKAKKPQPSQEDIHSLKLLHNHYLQWRYANAKAQVSMQAQKSAMENQLCSFGADISHLRDTVKKKQGELAALQRIKALFTIVEAQMPYLDEWSGLEEDYTCSLSGATNALTNSLLRLPVTGNVQVNIKEAAEALDSAVKTTEMIVDHMQRFLPKSAAPPPNRTTGHLSSTITGLSHQFEVAWVLTKLLGNLNTLYLSDKVMEYSVTTLTILNQVLMLQIDAVKKEDVKLVDDINKYEVPLNGVKRKKGNVVKVLVDKEDEMPNNISVVNSVEVLCWLLLPQALKPKKKTIHLSHCILTCVSSDGVMSEVVEKPKGIRRTSRIFVVHCEVKLEQCINAAFLPKSTGLSFSSSNLSSNNDTAIAVSQSFVESQHPPNESEQVHGASNSCPNSPISSQHTRTWPLPETRSSMTDEDILSSRLIVRSSSCSSTPAQLPTPQPTNVKLGVDSRKAKKPQPSQEDIHSLKLLHNHYLQWRYANAKAQVSMQAQKSAMENQLCSFGADISHLRDTVKKKQGELAALQRIKALFTIVEAQMPYLDEWSGLEEDYTCSLSGATNALTNSLLRLPVTGNVQVNIKEAAEALDSAVKTTEMIVDHMQRFLPKSAAPPPNRTTGHLSSTITGLSHQFEVAWVLTKLLGNLNTLYLSDKVMEYSVTTLTILNQVLMLQIDAVKKEDVKLVDDINKYEVPLNGVKRKKGNVVKVLVDKEDEMPNNISVVNSVEVLCWLLLPQALKPKKKTIHLSHCILTCVSSDGVMSEVVEKPKGIRRTSRIFVVHCEVKLEQCINAAFLPKSTGLSFSSSNLSSNNDTAIAVSQSFVESQHPPNESEQVHGASNSCPNSPISSQHTRTWPLPETRSSMTDEDILSSRLIVRSSSCSSTPAQLPTPQPTNVKLGVDSRKAKKPQPSQEDIHSLKLLHNHYLQWRYANAKAQVSMQAQKSAMENQLCSFGADISHLRDTVKKKQGELAALQRIKALFTIVEAQMPYLDEWSGLEEDYTCSLSGATNALTNSLLRLPVTGNVQVNIKEAAEALDSAVKTTEMIVDHMQRFLPKSAAPPPNRTTGHLSSTITGLSHQFEVAWVLTKLLGNLNTLYLSDKVMEYSVTTLTILNQVLMLQIDAVKKEDVKLVDDINKYEVPLNGVKRKKGNVVKVLVDKEDEMPNNISVVNSVEVLCWLLLPQALKPKKKTIHLR
ncbi:hypothetical protein LXL04_013544 [Taraxacum kok-saghyz]